MTNELVGSFDGIENLQEGERRASRRQLSWARDQRRDGP